MAVLSNPRPLVGVGTMIWRDSKMLLGRRRGAHGADTWGWCGGHLELGETPQACAAREIMEEAGLSVRPEELTPLCVNNVLAHDRHYVDIEFWTDRAIGDPIVREPAKVHAWEWFAPDGLPDQLFEPGRLAIDAWLCGRWCGPPPISSRGSP